MATAQKNKNAKKAPPNQQAVAQRRQKRTIRKLFEELSFARIKTDGKELTFKNRTGELDDIFVHQNILIVAEYTVGSVNDHLAKKAILYRLIHDNQEDWIEFCKQRFPDYQAMFDDQGFLGSEYRIKICYFSSKEVSEEMEIAHSFINFPNITTLRYFESLAKTIHKSAKHELFKFLGLDFKEIGAEVKNSSSSAKTFAGFVLPESHSSFPPGFKIVSFYADPDTLLTMSYVLRRDSWRDAEGMYQRVLMRRRMNDMRKYLTSEERVFVNNIIVTLPYDTKINDPNDPSKNLNVKAIKSVEKASVAIPFRSNTIGIVDGQHRVFCYHEGTDKYEQSIKNVRTRQNLLVTGVVYPETYSEVEKRRFEARLFLEINDKQRRTNSELKQSIELILHPYSTIAIAKAVIQRLNSSGPLKGMLQTNYFDPPGLIRTSSIVSYGLKPLLKLDGKDSLFSAWTNKHKESLRELQKNQADSSVKEPILDEYITFCAKSINDLLLAAKMVEGSHKWTPTDSAKDRHLSPTIINGYIVCLRRLVEKKKVADTPTYETNFQGLQDFVWSTYKSSHWKSLGDSLFKQFFS